MNIAETRRRVTAAYPGPVWAQKVKKMTDEQVYAIWMRMLEEDLKQEPKRDAEDNQLPLFEDQ